MSVRVARAVGADSDGIEDGGAETDATGDGGTIEEVASSAEQAENSRILERDRRSKRFFFMDSPPVYGYG
ncbi:hypothetical protein [Gorillibacterium timonense]|uniref:hypothetical protein n=1 Tax=Gorillibacterium timonense TaxID=1689269 RepID=UPI0011DD8BE3|nr:hypothetical protein [Gorillibacterium timonense]